MKKRTRWASFLLVLVMMISLLPVLSIEVEAASTPITTTDITNIINKWYEEYKQSGTKWYWNAYDFNLPSSEATLKQNISNRIFTLAGLGCTTSPKTEHGNEFSGGRSCVGFSKLIDYCLWGSSHNTTNCGDAGWKKYTPDEIGWNFLPGDVAISPKHNAIVWKVSGDTVEFMDVWGGSKKSVLNFGGFAGRYSSISMAKVWYESDHGTDYKINEVWRNESGYTTTDVKSILCSHPNISHGKCANCGYVYDYMATKNTADCGIYEVVGGSNGYTYMKEDPYADKNTWSKGIKKGSKLTVYYSVRNYFTTVPGKENENHTWYYASYSEKNTQKYGFIFSADVILKSKPSTSVSFSSNITQPYDYTENPYQVINLTSGLITAENGSIASVQAYFFRANTDGSQEANRLYPTPVIAVSEDAYPIEGNSQINKKLEFGKLSAGTYKYGIEAIDSTGKKWTWESNSFTVTPKAQPVMSNCTLDFGTAVAVDGGIRATISSSTPGAKISVTPADRVVQNNGSGVVIELTYSQTVTATASASGYKTVSNKQTYNVGSCSAPTLNTNETPEGTTITLTCPTSGAKLYYSLDGKNYEVYQKPFTLTKAQTVYAYAKKAGCTTSETVQQTISVTAPSAPRITTGTLGGDVAVGTVIAVSWPQVRNTSTYEVTITANGKEQTQTVTTPQVFVPAENAGVYQFQVRAKNSVGLSTQSNVVSVTAHAPVKVKFVNYDGAVLAEQTVPWGTSATAPSVPQRRGYTFAGYDQSFKNVTTDLTVTAQYEIKTYTVKFYDYDGETICHTQKIRFGYGIDSDDACAALSRKEGYVFTGWRVVTADADSEMDTSCVDSNMSLVAVRRWENTELPVVISNVAAIRDENATAYEVTYDITTAPSAELGGDAVGVKILAVLKSNQTGENGEVIPKTLAFATDSIMLQANQQRQTGRSITITLGNQSDYTKADLVEVYALALDGADRTGGALSRVATATPQITTVWSEWSDTKPADVAEENLRTRMLYRYRDNSRQTTSTTTCKEKQTSLNGWGYDRSREYWGSSFTSYDKLTESAVVKKVSEESVLQKNAYTQYRYGRWTNGVNNSFCPRTGYEYYGGSWREEYTAWTTSRYQTCGNDFYCSNTSHTHSHVAYTDGYGHNWHVYSSNGAYSASGRWFWEETQTIPATYQTKYTYQYKYYENIFYKWNKGNWSEWSNVPVTAVKDSRDVEIKVQYSYVTNDTSQVPDASGTEYSISGTLPLSGEMEGKLATVLVYKTRNTDPTESQLEYAEQITLGENADYALMFKNREDPDEYTGDYTVALALQGSNNLLNIAQIRYDAEYTVKFTDGEGKVLDTQTVRRGQDAAAPQPPEKDGFRFVKWDAQFTDVQSNMEVAPVWIPETWSVVFVDYVNQTVELQNDLETGTILPLPDVAGNDGFEFNGWTVCRGDGSAIEAENEISVDADLIAIADWTQQEYTVNFMNADGSVADTQKVTHGDAATPPESISVEEGKAFVGWSSEFTWWSVTENMNVLPVIMYETTTAAPASNLNGYVSGREELLILTAEENAKIYYTTDGSAPNILDAKGVRVYTDPIELTEDTTIKAVAVSEGKNESEIIEIDFVYQETMPEEQTGRIIHLQTANVIVAPSQTVELQVNLQNDPGFLSYQFVLQADPKVFGAPCDEDGAIQLAQALSGNGDIFVAPYDPEIGGWMVFWYSTEACKGNGPLLRLTLKTLEEAEPGTYPVELGYIAENTVTAEDALTQFDPAELQLSVLEGERLGDVNGDGLLTAVDVIRIAKYVINDYTFTAAQLAAADVTGDGKVTAADVIRLARYLVGLTELG